MFLDPKEKYLFDPFCFRRGMQRKIAFDPKEKLFNPQASTAPSFGGLGWLSCTATHGAEAIVPRQFLRQTLAQRRQQKNKASTATEQAAPSDANRTEPNRVNQGETP